MHLQELHRKLVALERKYQDFLPKGKTAWIYLWHTKSAPQLVTETEKVLEVIETAIKERINNTPQFPFPFDMYLKKVGSDKPLLHLHFEEHENRKYPYLQKVRWEAYCPQREEVKRGDSWLSLYEAGVIEEYLPLAEIKKRPKGEIKAYETPEGTYNFTLVGKTEAFEKKIRKLLQGGETEFGVAIEAQPDVKKEGIYPIFKLVVFTVEITGFAEKTVKVTEYSILRSPVLFDVWVKYPERRKEILALLMAKSNLV